MMVNLHVQTETGVVLSPDDWLSFRFLRDGVWSDEFGNPAEVRLPNDMELQRQPIVQQQGPSAVSNR